MPALQHQACEQLLNLGEDWVLAKDKLSHVTSPGTARLDGSPKQNRGSFVAREMLRVPAAALPKQGSAPKGSTAEQRGHKGDRWHGREGTRTPSSHCPARVKVKQIPFCDWRLLCQVIWPARGIYFHDTELVIFKPFSLTPWKLLLSTAKFK